MEEEKKKARSRVSAGYFEPESELRRDSVKQRSSEKLSSRRRRSWPYNSQRSQSQISSSKNKTLKSSTGKEQREEDFSSFYPPRFPTGQSLSELVSFIDPNRPVFSNQSACSQSINPSDADLSIARQSQACTDLEYLSRQYGDDPRSYPPQLSGEISHLPGLRFEDNLKGLSLRSIWEKEKMEEEKRKARSRVSTGSFVPSSRSMKSAHDDADPGENLKKDTCGILFEPESELSSDLRGGMGTPVDVKQYSDKKSSSRKRRSRPYNSQLSLSQTNSSKNKTLKSSTGEEQREEDWSSFDPRWHLKRIPRGRSMSQHVSFIDPNRPVFSNQSACSQSINPSDADLSIASQSQACTDLRRPSRQYRVYPRSDPPQFSEEIAHLPGLRMEDDLKDVGLRSSWGKKEKMEEEKRKARSRVSTKHFSSVVISRLMKSAHDDADPGENLKKDTYGIPDEPEGELSSDSVKQRSSEKSYYIWENPWLSNSQRLRSQTNSSKNKTLKSSTGEEQREEDFSSFYPHWFPIGQSVSEHVSLFSNQSACSQSINPSDADLSIASQSQACADLGPPSRQYRDYPRSYPPQLPGEISHLLHKTDTDESGPSSPFSYSPVSHPSSSQSTAPPVAGPPSPQSRPTVIQDSTVCSEGSGAQDAFQLLSVESDWEPRGGRGAVGAPVTPENYSVTSTLPAHGHLPPPGSRSDSSCLSRSHSMPSLSRMTSVENETFRLSFQDFTPDEHDETYTLRCSCPGLYRCSVTGLLFHMGGEGDVVYRTVPWDRRLLARHRKKPAGPLFEIQCEQRSVCGLHLPHCEICSAGGCDFLSVAHVKDEGIEFIGPRQITETHVVIDIMGFSAFGNVKDEDSPPDPVRALVLLFYRPPADPDPESLLNVLLLPRNVVLRDVLRIRKKLVGDESYIETSPLCKLNPEQEYTLSTCPEDDRVLVQPTEAEFDSNNYDNYFPSFQVTWETTLNHMKLLLRDTDSSHRVWGRRINLSAAGVRRSSGPSALNLPSPEKLFFIRTGFIEGISGPVLKSLLDKLLEKKVITDAERESADEMLIQRDKARVVIDTVRKKGEAASSEMIEFLCEADPFLCEHLGLI